MQVESLSSSIERIWTPHLMHVAQFTRLARIAAPLLALSVGLAACGTSLDREGTIEDLMAVGHSRTQAACIFDDSVAALGEDRILELNDEEITETAAERAQLDDILAACTAG